MLNVVIVLGIIILVGLLILGTIWYSRMKNFKPTENRLAQQRKLNSDLDFSGFAYNFQGDYFYSQLNCWQREMGYCRLYDEGAPFFNMIIDCEPVSFCYGGKRWLIELWKGQYGITTGAEIGVYNTTREDLDTEKFKGTFYEKVSDNELLQMAFVLRKNGKVLLRRQGFHWWLTGFKLGEFSEPSDLAMDAQIFFPNYDMCGAFVMALQNLGYRNHEFSVHGNKVEIHYRKPHTPKPISRNPVNETIVQQENEKNCMLYNAITGKYSHTLDKLEYLKTAMSELYDVFIHSLYAKGLYEAFDWIIEIIHNSNPPKSELCPMPKPKLKPCQKNMCPHPCKICRNSYHFQEHPKETFEVMPYPGLCPPDCKKYNNVNIDNKGEC
ncbi:DUF4474 domain-containing protein [Velocimicrobium porci]|nr:DUF4474 domain-containing protein [Velocimicrobium porci]